MADAIYDVVIVGGGHHGTVMGALLADAGLSVAIFERQREMGGGACGEDLPLPGFIQNTCAHYTRFWSHPAYAKLKLREHGLNYVMSGSNAEGKGCIGIAFDDGKCIVGYPAFIVKDIDTFNFEMSHSNIQRTLNEIARFSKRDAGVVEKYMNLFFEKMLQAFHQYEYTPPTPFDVPGPLERLVLDGSIPPEYQFYTVERLAKDLFESPEMQIYYMRMNYGATGCVPMDVPGLYGFIRSLITIFTVESVAVIYGGTHSITHALQRSFSANGGDFFVMKEVDKVLIENGRAAGVRLADGSEVKARKFVVSDVGVPQTIQRLIGEDNVPEQIAHRSKGINYDRAQIFWGNFAMHELPKYKAADFNPDINDLPVMFLAPNDVDYFTDRWMHEVFTKGHGDKMFPSFGCDSLWDPTRAPDGKHTIAVDEMAPPLRYLTEDQWLKLSRDIVPNKIMDFWQQCAPNMTRDNFIGHHMTSPNDVARRNIDMRQGGWCHGAMFSSQLQRCRPFPELADYRTPIKDLYLCSADQHPGGGIGRGTDICCYKAIAEDHGLPAIPGC